jgi:hypothetical protein
MYPLEQDILLSMQTSLREDLLPELTSPWAHRQAETLLWTLEHLRQRALVGHDLLVTEHGELCQLAAEVERARSSSTSAADVLAQVATVDLDGRAGAELPEAILQDELAKLRAIAEHVAEAVGGLLPAPTEPLATLRAVVLRYVHEQDARFERLYRVAAPS